MPSLSVIAMLACIISVIVTLHNINSGLAYSSEILYDIFKFRTTDVEFLHKLRMRLCLICFLTACVALLTLCADAVMINARLNGQRTCPMCEGPVPCVLVGVQTLEGSPSGALILFYFAFKNVFLSASRSWSCCTYCFSLGCIYST